jgi:hypothetical protein
MLVSRHDIILACEPAALPSRAVDLHILIALPLSAERGWPELLSARPGWWHLFLQIVLPVSLLPPAVLYLAGTFCPPVVGAGGRPWGELSMVVLLAEFASVVAAGRLFRQVAAVHGLILGPHESRLLAALAPLPLWASAAGFVLPGIAAPAAVLLGGLALACGIAYHGIVAICRPRETILAAAVVQVVAGAGLAAWGVLATLLATLS